MVKMYQRKKVPNVVYEWFYRKFPDCHYKFYTYKEQDNLIYGCNVLHFSKGFIHNGTQAPLEWFEHELERIV